MDTGIVSTITILNIPMIIIEFQWQSIDIAGRTAGTGTCLVKKAEGRWKIGQQQCDGCENYSFHSTIVNFGANIAIIP